MKRKIRKGDSVVVVSGEDKGTVGEVIRVIPEKGRVGCAGREPVHQAPGSNAIPRQDDPSLARSNLKHRLPFQM